MYQISFLLLMLFLIPIFNVLVNFSQLKKRPLITNRSSAMIALTGVLVIAILIRFMALLYQLYNFDHDSYFIIGQALSRKQDVYADAELVLRYPYLPLQMYLSLTAYYVDQNITGGFLFLCKIPAIVGDLLIILLLNKIIIQLTNSYNKAFFASLAYALCPISVMVSALHGQFDSLTLAFLLLSMYSFHKGNITMSSFWFSVSVTTKIWPVIFIPLFILLLPNNRERLKFLYILPLVPLGSIILYCWLLNSNPLLIIKATLEYGGISGMWGISALIDIVARPFGYDPQNINSFLSLFLRFIMLLVMLLYYRYKMSEFTMQQNILNILFLFLVFAPGFGSQWLLWLVPFYLVVIMTENKSDVARQIKAYNCFTTIIFTFATYGLFFLYVLVILGKSINDYGLANKIAVQLTALPLWLCMVVWVTQYRPRTRLLSFFTGQPRTDETINTNSVEVNDSTSIEKPSLKV
jgi:hypothetical protein